MQEMSHEDTQKSMPRKWPRCKEEVVHRMLAAEVEVDKLGGTRSFMLSRDPIAWYAFSYVKFSLLRLTFREASRRLGRSRTRHTTINGRHANHHGRFQGPSSVSNLQMASSSLSQLNFQLCSPSTSQTNRDNPPSASNNTRTRKVQRGICLPTFCRCLAQDRRKLDAEHGKNRQGRRAADEDGQSPCWNRQSDAGTRSHEG